MSLATAYFDRMYAQSPDPWGFRDRWYERRKRALTLAALPRRQYRSAFEPGCSIGELTVELAGRCDRLLAVDVAADAVTRARTRVAPHPWVAVRQWGLPRLPDEPVDLLVLSEVAYYLDPDEWAALLPRLPRALTAGGDLVAVHWRHPVPEYPQTGDAVHAALAGAPGLARVSAHVETDFLLEVYTRTGGPLPSVARREGLC